MHTNSHHAPVLLFDGVCNLCNASVQWVLLRDKQQIFRFAALQSEVGQKILARHGLHNETLDTVVLSDGDRVFVRSDAPLEVLRRLGGFWRFFYVFKYVPKPLRDAVYRFIARNRYRWFGRKESCLLPRPEWRERFLA
jgi:predicted DCC family thiol-disulfide oxidoreductase YuxK